MLIVAGFQSNGLFDAIGSRLLAKTKNTAQLMLVLVFLCFFSSMFITNDVALLTFVPFACTILQKCHQERLIVTAFVLQTLAANLGSMLTPVGNPQNLYLYSISGAGLGEFVGWMAPYTLVSGVLLLLVVFVLSAGKRRIALETGSFLQASGASGRKKNGIYLALFVLSLLSVARVLPWELMLAVVLIVLIFTDRAVFLQVDYCLLFTFISFFIFIVPLVFFILFIRIVIVDRKDEIIVIIIQRYRTDIDVLVDDVLDFVEGFLIQFLPQQVFQLRNTLLGNGRDKHMRNAFG